MSYLSFFLLFDENVSSFIFASVVTVDGILLTKAGTMTGGTTGGIEAKSNQWDDKKIEGMISCEDKIEGCL